MSVATAIYQLGTNFNGGSRINGRVRTAFVFLAGHRLSDSDAYILSVLLVKLYLHPLYPFINTSCLHTLWNHTLTPLTSIVFGKHISEIVKRDKIHQS